jgi:cysteine sulfinate desulfinase/cysteine desulfurase-like protein
LGLTEDETRSSLRIGIGRFNSMNDIHLASSMLSNAYKKLSRLIKR